MWVRPISHVDFQCYLAIDFIPYAEGVIEGYGYDVAFVGRNGERNGSEGIERDIAEAHDAVAFPFSKGS